MKAGDGGALGNYRDVNRRHVSPPLRLQRERSTVQANGWSNQKRDSSSST